MCEFWLIDEARAVHVGCPQQPALIIILKAGAPSRDAVPI